MQTILITGAGSGIGLATTELATKAGHRVIAAIHREEQRIALPEGTTAHVGDLTDPAFRAMLAETYAAQIDALVCNAGYGETGPLIEHPEAGVRKLFEVNVMATLLLAQPFGQAMARRGKGRLVFVASMAGFVTVPNLGAYSASKHAMIAIVDALRVELAPFGVSVVGVEPGPISTGFNERMAATKYAWMSPTSLYASQKEAWKVQDAGLPERSHPVGPVAEIVLSAATAPAPRAHNPAPLSYRPYPILQRLLPIWFIDSIVRKHRM